MMQVILRILALTRKELLAVLKDPRSRLSLLMPPLMQCLIYGYAATYDLNNVPYAVLDRDHSISSYALLAKFDGSGVFKRVADLVRQEDVARLINDHSALLVIEIEREFERKLVSGQPAGVQVIADGRNSNTAATATGYVNTLVESFNADWRAAHGADPVPLRVVSRAWYNPNFETRWHMIPGMIATLTMLQTMMLTALSVAREREQGTFDQLLVTPYSSSEIMAGKALPSMLIGLAQATLVLLVAQLWFHIPFAGSYVTLYLGLGTFLIAAVGIGLLLSAVSATMQQAMLYTFVVLMPFMLLSGLTTPISNMPESLQYLTLVNPLRHAITLVQRVYLEGAPLAVVMPYIIPLLLIGAVTLSAATVLFRYRLN
ncbi:MAG: ABC transporter permease [Methylobacter sp.]|nr:ABC transporter permease [Methylobacter sp.]